MIFDSHAHYDDAQFDSDRDSLLSGILPQKGVCGIINAASSYESLESVTDLCQKYSYVYGAVGIHPECAAALPENWLLKIESLAGNNKICAIGEIGLDYHWLDECPKDIQKDVFIKQLKLSKELSLPVLIHDREAHGDMLALIKEYEPRGVVHCFSGSLEMAKELVSLGMYIGIGGAVTFKNAKHIINVAGSIPLEYILLETDSPYMSPEPFRGKRNDSSLIKYVAEKISDIRKIPADKILRATAQNAEGLFGIVLPEVHDVI